MMKSKIKTAFFLFFLILIPSLTLPSLALAQAPPVASWWGTVTTDAGTLENTNGAVVEAYIDGSVVAHTTVGQYTSGHYLIDVPCHQGNGVTIKVQGTDGIESVQTCVPGTRTRVDLSAAGAEVISAPGLGLPTGLFATVAGVPVWAIVSITLAVIAFVAWKYKLFRKLKI